MVARGGGGKLVVTSSIGSIHGMPRQPNYAASKAGVIALVRSLAVELGRHDIQANAILPGWIETDMTAPAVAWKKLHDTIVQRTPGAPLGHARRHGGDRRLSRRQGVALPQRRRPPRRRRLRDLLIRRNTSV